MNDDRLILDILDLARWAPSGDNTQPWRFEIVDARHLVVHGFDTRAHCVYDLDGHPSQISLGALLENIALAASGHGLDMQAQRRRGCADTAPTFDIALVPACTPCPDPLAAHIAERSVQRRPLAMRSLSGEEKAALEGALPDGYRLLWLDAAGQRLAAARLMFNNAKLRLTMPEAYQVHRSVIEWDARFSRDRIPDQALGVDPATAKLMRWIMRSWRRVAFFNRYLAGTVAPRIQMDLVPALACAAHVVLLARQAPATIDDYVGAGRAMQRFWLMATRLGLQFQPEMTPLIFARYLRDARPFSSAHGMQELAHALAIALSDLVGDEHVRHAVFMGRIGAGKRAVSRSTRLPLGELMVARAGATPRSGVAQSAGLGARS